MSSDKEFPGGVSQSTKKGIKTDLSLQCALQGTDHFPNPQHTGIERLHLCYGKDYFSSLSKNLFVKFWTKLVIV